MATSTSGSKSLKEYLKRYESKDDEEKKKKKKKKKKKEPRADAGGVLVVDEDPVWQKPVDLAEENSDDSEDEAKPQIDEDIEVKRMRRLELLRARRPFHSIAEDGSGWVSLSPKRSQIANQDSDLSLPHLNQKSSPEHELKPSNPISADLSPPCLRQRRQDTPSPGSTPERLHSNAENSDMSPPCRKRVRNDTPSPEPGLKNHLSGKEYADLSPLRRQRRQTSSPDISPPRRRKAESVAPSSSEPNSKDADFGVEGTELSHPGQQQRHHSRPAESHPISAPSVSLNPDSFLGRTVGNSDKISSETPDSFDISPPRRGHHHSRNRDNLYGSDLSPPRKSQMRSRKQSSPDHHSHREPQDIDVPVPVSVSDLSPPRKSRKVLSGSADTREGLKTGLISGKDISKEMEKKEKEQLSWFNALDASITGKGAEPVYRDKLTGKRLSKEEVLKSKQKEEEKPKEKKLEWGKGLAQKREAEERMQELELEKDKPFTRTRDDPELEKMLKERVRWGDPMAHLVKNKHSEQMLPNLGDNEKMKESGFIIPQDIPNHSWLKRGLDAAPNRYGIRPGRHWDGVDRSNGYEKELFKRMNEKQASEREAYLWSVSDM